MLHDLPPPTVVSDESGFRRMLEVLASVDELAVDTEADSFFSYRDKVCLLQVTAAGEDWIVDPLAWLDLSNFGRVLADPRKVKVFHDGEYDILILKRDHGFRFANLFDTRVAAATLGSQAPGLASVLKERFGVELDKSMQRSNWAQRPLTPKQLAYARLDTHFLLPLMKEQRSDLARLERAMIVDGECRRLEGIEPPRDDFNPDEYAKIKGARLLSAPARAVLRELYIVREGLAESINEPPFRVVNNETMVLIAERAPKAVHELTRVPGFSAKQARRWGEALLAAVEKGLASEPVRRLPSLPSKDGTSGFDQVQQELHERLKAWRKDEAAKVGIDSAYLLNRHVLLELTLVRPTTSEALRAIVGLQAWQLERFGDGLLDVLRRFEEDLAAGRVELRGRWRK